MQFDIFFSISQTPAEGGTPSEHTMFQNCLSQVEAADSLGFGVAWFAESHLSSQVQKQNPNPVIVHWEGEVGLNVDIFQLAHTVFHKTQRIEVGSAITNILCNGGPIAAAERVASFATLHGINPEERRRLHVGFAAGRFDFMNRAYGIKPRNELETLAWRALKGQVFREASEIFCRLLRGDTLSSDDIPQPVLQEKHFRSSEEWEAVQALAGGQNTIEIPRYWDFEKLKIIPQDWRRSLIQLVIGSHDPDVQTFVNEFLPVQVFNLSITQPEKIEATHQRMTAQYHPDGGPWNRTYMPRTTFVFINEDPGLSPEARSRRAQEEARHALSAYWTALEGTLDPNKVERAAQNALIGNSDEIATQIQERFHPDDRLMLWFDFFNHDNHRVIANMEAFMESVVPKLPLS